MIRSFINSFGSTLYVQIWEHRIRVVDIKTNKVFDEKPLLQLGKTHKNSSRKVVAFGNEARLNSLNPFSHPRNLFCDFEVGEKLLQEIIKKLIGKAFFSPAPAIIIHPMEKTEGGLTMIEVRAFKEMAYGAGAREVTVYQGKKTLTPSLINFEDIKKQEKLITYSS